MLNGDYSTASAFRLIPVKIGKQSVSARPVAWDRPDETGQGVDKAGVPIEVTELITTCPYCAQLIRFPRTDLVNFEDEWYIGCISCKRAPPVVVKAASPIIQPVTTTSTLIDPSRACVDFVIDADLQALVDASLNAV